MLRPLCIQTQTLENYKEIKCPKCKNPILSQVEVASKRIDTLRVRIFRSKPFHPLCVDGGSVYHAKINYNDKVVTFSKESKESSHQLDLFSHFQITMFASVVAISFLGGGAYLCNIAYNKIREYLELG